MDKGIKKKKTSVQEFFEEVEMYNTGVDWNAVEHVFAQKTAIEDELIKDILATIKNIEDYGILVKKEVSLGLTPEEPGSEVQQAKQNIQFSFLRELEHDGVIKNLREITKEESDNENYWSEIYAVINFYPKNLRDYLIYELPVKRQNESIKSANLYIVKEGEDFKYNGALLDKIGKGTNYYKVFNVVYILLPTGGKETYDNIGREIRKCIPMTINFSAKKMAKFIQDNLGIHNGFLHHAKKIENTLSGGKELIHIVRGEGVEFNNRKGA